MVKYLEIGEKSRLFYTFCQLHPGVVKVIIFFKLNTMLFENILTLQKWPKKCFIVKFREKRVRYCPKKIHLKKPFLVQFSPKLLLLGQMMQLIKKCFSLKDAL